MRTKGITIWLFSTLTVITMMHLIDSVNALFFSNQIQLLQLYPFANTFLTQMSIQTYFYVSAGASAILWGITCILAFDNPVETFLNHILSDAQKQRSKESQIVEDNGGLFDLMYEKMESDSEVLLEVKDLIRNVRTEVRDIAPIKESMLRTKRDLNKINKQLISLEEQVLFPLLCNSCKKPIRADFKVCPYCSELLKLPEVTISHNRDFQIK
ncbi:hypothetical protein JJE00_07035 [Candidatus Bathyarchaeota archaeon]|nr:hypothetical protein [Candidatus Bathyarchaeota archaeon]